MEKAVARSQERYKSLFENSHAVMLIIDPESAALLDVNSAACAYYGWKREEFLKKRIDEINTLTSEEIRTEMQLARTEKRSHFFFKHRRGVRHNPRRGGLQRSPVAHGKTPALFHRA